MPEKFHDKSKEAGNKLKENILNFSAVATGVFFFTLTEEAVSGLGHVEKVLLLVAMSFFAITVVLCLLELHVDSKRFFAIAKQKEKPESEQDWGRPRKLKRLRIKLIHATYVTVTFGFLITFIYMVQRLA